MLIILSSTLSIFAIFGGIVFMVIFWKYRTNALSLQNIKKGTLYYTSNFLHLYISRARRIQSQTYFYFAYIYKLGTIVNFELQFDYFQNLNLHM
jgi:hypothetical protein